MTFSPKSYNQDNEPDELMHYFLNKKKVIDTIS